MGKSKLGVLLDGFLLTKYRAGLNSKSRTEAPYLPCGGLSDLVYKGRPFEQDETPYLPSMPPLRLLTRMSAPRSWRVHGWAPEKLVRSALLLLFSLLVFEDGVSQKFNFQ